MVTDIRAFKAFLEKIAYSRVAAESKPNLQILLDFFKDETPESKDNSLPYLQSLLQTWTFAMDSNIDSLLSAVPSVLALLLKTISTLIDFRDYGLGLCRALLLREQVKLFHRGMTATKTKEHLISPCIRLLTEIVSFDGGHFAKHVYRLQDVTFNRLDVFLTMSSVGSLKLTGTQNKPSVRSNALRYLLTNIRLQDQTSKSDLLSQTRLTRGLLQDLNQDSPDNVVEVLTVLRKYVALDDKLSRTAKSRFFTDWTLNRLAGLYRYADTDNDTEGPLDIPEAAHEFLLFICTTVDLGVLIAQDNWYPPVKKATVDHRTDILVMDRELPQYKPLDRVIVRNSTLSLFLQGLRPYASTLQRDLILTIFNTAPELVADYFIKKRSFSFEPKLSATWIGYAAFLYSVIRLPLPYVDFKIWQGPPPPLIVLESILPQPLDNKTMTRCMNHSSSLITFFAVRILIIAFEKLEKCLSYFRKAGDTASGELRGLWERATASLLAEFSRRCPETRYVIAVFRRCKEEEVLLREATSRLLAAFYRRLLPLLLEEKLDITVAMSGKLDKSEAKQIEAGTMNMERLELQHLLDIARTSPQMNWWQKPSR